MKEIITHIQEIVYYLRVQNYHEGSLRFQRLLKELQESDWLNAALETEESSLAYVLLQMTNAMEAGDMVLLADLLNEAFLPEIRKMACSVEVQEIGNYMLEGTSSGYVTAKHIPSGVYLHSNENPMEEARLLVNQCFDPWKGWYAVWGCGLGYHISRLFEAANRSILIKVFDEEEQIFQLARKNGVLNKIPSDKISFIADPTGEKFAQCIERGDAGILLHLKKKKKIQNQGLKNAIHQFFAGWNGTVQMENLFAINFRNNVNRCDRNVDELKEVFRGREIILAAAGPSLDHSLAYLKANKGEKIIVAVTTVLKKLLQSGIAPDYAVVMDAQERTLSQIEGIYSASVPLILDSTAYWEFADKYKGEKYLALQKGYAPAEKFAAERDARLYETGGSVTTLALDIILKSGAKAVYFIGADFAYPDGMSHAEDTMDRKKRDLSGLERVKSVKGQWVYTDVPLNSYRKWIEKKIKEYPQVEFYNLSDCGAAIAGTFSLK